MCRNLRFPAVSAQQPALQATQWHIRVPKPTFSRSFRTTTCPIDTPVAHSCAKTYVFQQFRHNNRPYRPLSGTSVCQNLRFPTVSAQPPVLQTPQWHIRVPKFHSAHRVPELTSTPPRAKLTSAASVRQTTEEHPIPDTQKRSRGSEPQRRICGPQPRRSTSPQPRRRSSKQ